MWIESWRQYLPTLRNDGILLLDTPIRGKYDALTFESSLPTLKKIRYVEEFVSPIAVYDAREFWDRVSLVPGKFMDPRGWVFTWSDPHPEMLRHRGPVLWDTGKHLVEPTMFCITDKFRRDRMIGRIYPYYYTLANDIMTIAGLDATYGKEAPTEFERMTYHFDSEEVSTY